MAMPHQIYALAMLVALNGTAFAQASPSDLAHRAFPAGQDFCFARTYDAKHLAAHPLQIIASLQVMGRNAWEAEPRTGTVFASLVATFRDGAKPLVLHGACWQPDQPDRLRCKFVPKQNQDILEIGMAGTLPAPDQLRADISGDWKTVRRGVEPTQHKGMTTDDATFVLLRRPVSACAFPPGFWTAKGPTRKLMEQLP